jgi:hypothetical protein
LKIGNDFLYFCSLKNENSLEFMKRIKHAKKTILFSIALGFAMLSMSSVNAQNRLGGLFGASNNDDPSRGGLMSPGTRSDSFTVNTQNFGGAPLGSGIAVLLGLGLGYAALKRKEDKQ